jgi:hypothetical protein
MDKDFDEPILDDDYPVFTGFLYVADGDVLRSPIKGTVASLKRQLCIKEIRRCDMAARELF